MRLALPAVRVLRRIAPRWRIVTAAFIFGVAVAAAIAWPAWLAVIGALFEAPGYPFRAYAPGQRA